MLLSELVQLLQHLIASLDDPRVGLIRPLRQDHGDELIDDTDVGLLQHALLQCSQTVRPTWRTNDRLAGSRGLQIDIVAHGIQAAWIDKEGRLNAADLGGRRLP